jgi:hypothetical protein
MMRLPGFGVDWTLWSARADVKWARAVERSMGRAEASGQAIE